MKTLLPVFTAAHLIMGLASLLGAEKSASVAGTWKLDVGKSNYSTGSLPKSATRTIEAEADGEKTTYQQVDADGTEAGYAYAAGYDDKDAPITGSGKATWREDLLGGAETITIRKGGSNAYSVALKKSGLIVMTMRVVVSKDGRVLTITSNGADAKGQPTKSVTVWDKQ